MKLIQKQSPNVDYKLDISLSINIDTDEQNYSSNLKRIQVDASINVGEEKRVEEIFVEQDTRGAVQPAIFEPYEQQKLLQKRLTVVSPKDQHTNLRFYIQFLESQAGPFVFKLPPFHLVKIADGLISGPLEQYNIEDLCAFYNTDSEPEAIFNLLTDMKNWMSIRTHFRLLDSGARLSESIHESISSAKTTGFLARQIAYPESEVSYTISSMRELDQILSTCGRLDNIPKLNKYGVLSMSLKFIESEEFLSQFWKVETQFEIGREHWKGLLNKNQMMVLLALSVAKKDYNRAQDIIQSWIEDPPKISNIDDRINELKASNARPQEWRNILPETLEKDKQKIEYVLSLYLRSFDKFNDDNKIENYLKELLAEARAKIADRINLSLDAEVANYRYYSTRGQRFKENKKYAEAASEYRNSLSIALEHISNSNSERLLNPTESIYWIYILEAEEAAQNEDYQKAIKKIENGINIIQNYSNVDKSLSKYYTTRFKANKYELEGDKQLSKQNLNKAESKYGQAIYNYTEINRESERDYLLKRNKLITASLAEQRGDFEAAKQAHKNIAKMASKDTFKKFNISRKQMCEAKKLIVGENWEKARTIISNIEGKRNLSGVEAEHLSLVIDAYDAYEEGRVQDCRKVLNELDSLKNISAVADEFPFEYGHDYRPALVNILAAQRLKSLGIDENLIDELVDVSVRAVLSPNQAKIEISQWGISDVGLRQQWRHRFPTHIVKRYEELNTKATVAGNEEQSYSDEALGLLRLLEQTLEFAGDYFAHNKYGPDWQHKFTNNRKGRLSLGDLRDFLNNDLMQKRVWQKDVCHLLDERIIGVEDVVELRNQFGHDRKPHIDGQDYQMIENRINEIFSRIRSEIPVMGEVVGRHKLGAYRFAIHWENATDWCYISISEQLSQDSIYYLPPDSEIEEKVLHPDPKEIIECSSERALNNLRDYTSLD